MKEKARDIGGFANSHMVSPRTTKRTSLCISFCQVVHLAAAVQELLSTSEADVPCLQCKYDLPTRTSDLFQTKPRLFMFLFWPLLITI